MSHHMMETSIQYIWMGCQYCMNLSSHALLLGENSTCMQVVI